MRFNPFGRRAPELPRPEFNQLAVPMSAEDVRLLVRAYQEEDRLTRQKRPHLSRRDQGRSVVVLKAAALAHALGHAAVPMPVAQLPMLKYVTMSLLDWKSGMGDEFATFELKLNALSALSARNGWLYEYDGAARAWRWAASVAMDTLPPQLTAGPGRA